MNTEEMIKEIERRIRKFALDNALPPQRLIQYETMGIIGAQVVLELQAKELRRP